MEACSYPDAINRDLVGTYPAEAQAGGGLVWDDVLEYRVWRHPEQGSPDRDNGNDYYLAFATYAEAADFSRSTKGAEEPLALIRQLEYIDEPTNPKYDSGLPFSGRSRESARHTSGLDQPGWLKAPTPDPLCC